MCKKEKESFYQHNKQKNTMNKMRVLVKMSINFKSIVINVKILDKSKGRDIYFYYRKCAKMAGR